MTSATEYDQDFRQRAARQKTWGTVLLVVAAGLWVWFAYLLTDCAALLFRDAIPGAQCLDTRTWWEPFAVLGVSVPFAILGAGLHITGLVTLRMSGHREAMQYFESESASEGSR
ncbi:hypothetical protein [Streptomyces sp. Isolate_219]|uniref:hypothetical protein n=1 Tax=Streptomyces sp. Isolate_219 TaxID=2950110 RepID=UPI0021CA892C|nr:hypothetical protein [Streptomyces sp. Isolate_219]MCR8573588.1 hypothetical protein [Streptomyces sp. Isolate_219]